MNYSFLFAPVAALAVSFSVSLAESRIPDHPADPLLRPASGSLKAGYSTRYESVSYTHLTLPTNREV